jgi:hypothetical protein
MYQLSHIQLMQMTYRVSECSDFVDLINRRKITFTRICKFDRKHAGR